MKKEYVPQYWNGLGRYQIDYDDLYDELVPREGKAPTERGEILRIVSRLHYDIYNNGGCNFSNYTAERAWLNNHVPAYAKKITKEFTKSIKYGVPQSQERMQLIDRYISWAILYVKALGSLELLEKALGE